MIRRAPSRTGAARLSSTPRTSVPFTSAPSCSSARDGSKRPPSRGVYIVDYCDARGWDLTAVWPKQELQRLRELLAEH